MALIANIGESSVLTSPLDDGNILTANLSPPYIQIITVGIDKDFLTINEAITAARKNYTIVIDPGTYNEYLDLTTKKLNFIGLGDREVIIYYQTGVIASPSTLNIGISCRFTNIIFDKTTGGNAVNPVVNVSGCNPVFTDCIIRHEGNRDLTQNLITIANDSCMDMDNCTIEGWNMNNQVFLADTSSLYFEGDKFKAKLLVEDNAIASINTDTFYTDSACSRLGLNASDDSKVYLTINTREIYWDWATNSEYPTGQYGANSYKLSGNAYLKLSGNQITGSTRITGAGVEVLFKDIISTLGHFWMETLGVASTALITFDNCQIVSDMNNDITGLHIIEESVGAEVRIINGSRLEFSGHNGNWFTMGNPIVCAGKLYIRDSEIVDNVNDNIPYGANYQGTILIHNKLDAEDVIITNQNWDAVGINRCINFQKPGVDPINIRLKNVVLNNSEIDTSPIHFQGNEANLDGDDYICQENITNNTTQFILSVATGVPATTWATLTGNCP